MRGSTPAASPAPTQTSITDSPKARRFKPVDYEQSRQQVVTLGECLPSDHLVYFIVLTIGEWVFEIQGLPIPPTNQAG